MLHIEFNSKGLDCERIAKFIKKGNIVVYPTDTVYGVGASIESEAALKKIYEAKSRNFSSPLIALVSNKSIVGKIAKIPRGNKKKYEKLVEKFWPGGLTIILEKKDSVPDIMVSHGSTVGVRMPNHELALKIIESAGGVIPTTSANISGEATPRSFEEVSPKFRDRVDIVINDGACPIGVESTIIDLSKKEIKLLRVGAISKEMIEAEIGEIQ